MKTQGPPSAQEFLNSSASPAVLLSGTQAFTTLPLRRQDVQTRIRLVAPFTLARIGRRLTFQRRRETLWAWLMWFPNCGPLPQISQTCAMTAPDGIRT